MIQVAVGLFRTQFGRAILARKQIDDRRVVDPHRRKPNFTGAEFLDALTLQSQHIGVKRKRSLDIADVEHDMVQLDYLDLSHG